MSSDDITDETGEPEDADIFEDIDQPETATDVSEQTSKGVLKIDKTNYAVGLHWHTAEESGKAAKEARLAAKDDDQKADFFCVREADVSQYGLGRKDAGHKMGMPSLAAALAHGFTGNWLAAFSVAGGYYIAAMREGLILSDSDRFYVAEINAREEFEEFYFSTDWDDVIAPEGWGDDEVQTRTIASLIDGATPPKLQVASATGIIIKGAFLLAVLGGLVYGGNYAWTMYRASLPQTSPLAEPEEPPEPQGPTLAERREQLQEMLENVEDSVKPVLGIEETDPEPETETPPDPPWFGKQNGVGTLISCTSDIKAVSMTVPGWDITRVSCGAGNVSLSLSKSGGTVPWAEHYFQSNGFPNADFRSYAGTDSLSFRYPASYVSGHAADLSTQPLDDIKKYLNYQFAEWGESISFDRDTAGMSQKQDRYYYATGYSVDSAIAPTEFAELFSRVPGLVVNTVRYSVADGRWSFSGAIYHTRDTPIPPPEPEEDPQTQNGSEQQEQTGYQYSEEENYE